MTPRTRPTRLLAAVSVGLGAIALTACGSGVSTGAAPASSGEAISIENCGRTVEIPATPTAVVGLHPSQTELLLRLGLADSLVGQAQATADELPSDVADLAADVPVIGGDAPPSREELLAVEPDFVYSPTTYEFTAEQGFASIEQLSEAGVAAYTATGGCFDRRMEGTVDDLFIDLENLGEIFHVEDEANDLIESSKAELATVDAALEGQGSPPRRPGLRGGHDPHRDRCRHRVRHPEARRCRQRLHAGRSRVRRLLRRRDHPGVARVRGTGRDRLRGVRPRARGGRPLLPRRDVPRHARRARRSTDRGAVDRPVPRHTRERLGRAADRRGPPPGRRLRLSITSPARTPRVAAPPGSSCAPGGRSLRARPA
ncbi:ABC transporter substrate-binding protein [Microbacterium oxydans]|nr:ABC transporter substrate-binding protein [Microbacterium oxydans]